MSRLSFYLALRAASAQIDMETYTDAENYKLIIVEPEARVTFDQVLRDNLRLDSNYQPYINLAADGKVEVCYFRVINETELVLLKITLKKSTRYLVQGLLRSRCVCLLLLFFNGIAGILRAVCSLYGRAGYIIDLRGGSGMMILLGFGFVWPLLLINLLILAGRWTFLFESIL